MTLMHTTNQVAEDRQLLDIARDYFQFATNFFEVINVSATHIYHSALELSPLSSIVRKFYYSHRPHPSPRVVIGTPDSWDPSTASVSTKHSYYLSSTWSPCSQSVATVTKEAVEVRDALALKLLSTLRPASLAASLRRGLAFSPDGHSLAGCSNTGIVIWDTQTGGVVGMIEREITGHGLELVWSLDGRMIGTISPRVSETLTVCAYDVASGAMRSSETVQSTGSGHLWAHDGSFRLMTTTKDRKTSTINIYEVGSGLTKVEQFSFPSHPAFGVFSPSTYRISVSVTRDHNRDPELLILNVRNSEVLLRETGPYWRTSFSPDGNFVAAFAGNRLPIWIYASGRYTQWREFQQTPTPLQFSPSSSSILDCDGAVLNVLHLDHLRADPATGLVAAAQSRALDAFSPYSTHIATTHRGQSVVTITNLRSQKPSPSQFIDTDLEISAMVLTGNVLLVHGSDTVVAWLLTEEGAVDGILDGRRAGRNDSLWDVSPRAYANAWARLLQRGGGGGDGDNVLEFSVGDETAAIRHNGHVVRVYHIKTGETLESGKAPSSTGYRFHNPRRDDTGLYRRDLRKNRKSPECGWPVSQTTPQEGWVKDPEGNHRLWLRPRWRSAGNEMDWLDEVTTLRVKNSSELAIIKF